MVTKNKQCFECQQLGTDSSFVNCDDLYDQGIEPRLPPAVYEIESKATIHGDEVPSEDTHADQNNEPAA